MGDDNKNIKYTCVMTRGEAREWHGTAETAPPKTRAMERWFGSLSAELYHAANVDHGPGIIKAKAWPAGQSERDQITLELTRDAVQAIRHLAIGIIVGDLRPGATPAPKLQRTSLLRFLDGIGPDGVLRRMVEKEAKLPESPDLDEDDLDLSPKKE